MGGRLDGKTVVVTGAASRGEGVGTGKAIAVLSAREGAKVVLVNRSAERAEGLAEEIRAGGGEAFVFAGDVTEEADANAMAAAAEAHFGRIDALVNNVGGSRQQGAVMEIGREGWDATLAVNLTSAMLCARACIPAMQRAGGGSILNISSVVGARGLLSRHGLRRLRLGQGGPARPHPVARHRLCEGRHPLQLHYRRHDLHADGGAPGPGGPRAPRGDGAARHGRHGLGHRLGRGLSDERRSALDHRRAPARRRRPPRHPRLAAIGGLRRASQETGDELETAGRRCMQALSVRRCQSRTARRTGYVME